MTRLIPLLLFIVGLFFAIGYTVNTFDDVDDLETQHN